MLEMYKGREVKAGQKVKVYYNLHKHVFSIQDAKTGKVLAHGNNILLEDVEYKVSEAGRQRVLREKKKNVHAFVVGTFVGTAESLAVPLKDAYYNPYTVKTFVDKESGKGLSKSQMAYLKDKQVQYI